MPKQNEWSVWAVLFANLFVLTAGVLSAVIFVLRIAHQATPSYPDALGLGAVWALFLSSLWMALTRPRRTP
ncbi:hypothetical protein LCGC14_1022780 [marine sediment metagenome]|uniref:Uncharacterized protein n=1 Tax=marine sediment metagenome TaxID=412755 RepID=A0A0F9MX46_9ZZZZ